MQPIAYDVRPPFSELAQLVENGGRDHQRQWQDSLDRAVDAVAGLTAVDGATLMTSTYEVLAFGAKIVRRRGQPQVEQMTVTEPILAPIRAIVPRFGMFDISPMLAIFLLNLLIKPLLINALT